MSEPAGRPRLAPADALSIQVLEAEPYSALSELRKRAPVAWVRALNGWLVTTHEAALTVMRDAETFTVDDPRFSTAAVLGPSMLSLEGEEHRRHRNAFAASFRPTEVRTNYEQWLREECAARAAALDPTEAIELRTSFAGPLAAATISRFLGLVDTSPETILSWYQEIAAAIVAVSVGQAIPDLSARAIESLRSTVVASTEHPASSLIRQIHQTDQLSDSELESEVAVLMFGAIETSEGMIANALWHLLSNPHLTGRVCDDDSLLAPLVEESLRLEPAATRVDRYCTRDVTIGNARIKTGDLVIVSLLSANRDPEVFEDPDQFRIDRSNIGQHVTFVQGPHSCLGLHLARLEATEALRAIVAAFPDILLDRVSSRPPAGLIFRKPPAVVMHSSGPST